MTDERLYLLDDRDPRHPGYPEPYELACCEETDRGDPCSCERVEPPTLLERCDVQPGELVAMAVLSWVAMCLVVVLDWLVVL